MRVCLGLLCAISVCFGVNVLEDDPRDLDSVALESKGQLAPEQLTIITYKKPAQTMLDLRAFIGFDSYLDNLEGDNALWATRTLYALRLSPEIGLGINHKHALMFGGFVLQNMGARTFPTKANITAYYAYSNEGFGSLVGIFPRTKLKGHYPLSFFRPDFLFFQPNVNGLALNIYTKGALLALRGEFVFDWYGGNLSKRYDEFYALAHAEVDMLHFLYLRANGLVYHIKNEELLSADGSKNPANPLLPNTQLLDKILYEVAFGVDFAKFVSVEHLQKADIGIAALGSLERKRQASGLGDFYVGSGGEIRASLQYKGFGIEESYYFGKPQMRYFGEYGESVYNGLPFYQASSLNRINAYYEYRNDFLRVNVGFMFYNFDRQFALSQMLTLTLDTQKVFKRFKS
ncbi:hypothetical protein [Helicobacter canis]|uniref:hypothetical protein n=1 Tax=Helicobacter canis TaxID=29419 RepID=UPI0029432592|nr:hypothetical protein [Helicobacter canis]